MIFVGDIHIDKTFPFTNKKTAERWRALQDVTIGYILNLEDRRIQVGDLFDNFMVDASDFIRGHTVARGCYGMIRGNHDVSNNKEQQSALQLLGVITPSTSLAWDEVECWAYKAANYVFVPHQRTQELFEKALYRAIELTTTQIRNILVLHCNFGDRPGTDTENYLRTEMLGPLQEKFEYIISGHEHNTHEPRKGIRMTGSILPMNFGEMTDKFVWCYEGPGKLLPLKVWSADEHYRNLDYKEFLELPVGTSLQFIQINGSVDLSESVLISKKVADWYLHSDTIIAIKNNTTKMEREVDAEKKTTSADWVAEVTKQLNEAELKVFMELLNGDRA